MSNKSFFSNKIEDKKAIQEFGNIKIENNAIYYNKSALQISNISRTWIGQFAKDAPPPFPIWTIVGFIISLGLIFAVKQFVAVIIGIAIAAICGYMIYKHVSRPVEHDRFGLQIEMNSGFLAIFSSYDEKFLQNFQNAITDDFIARNEHNATTINMDNRTVVDNNGVISYGDHNSNVVNNGVR